MSHSGQAKVLPPYLQHAISITADRLGISYEDVVRGGRRSEQGYFAQRCLYYALTARGVRSANEISRALGRPQSTVHRALVKARALRDSDPWFRSLTDDITEKVHDG